MRGKRDRLDKSERMIGFCDQLQFDGCVGVDVLLNGWVDAGETCGFSCKDHLSVKSQKVIGGVDVSQEIVFFEQRRLKIVFVIQFV